MDFQEPYSVGLARRGRRLAEKGRRHGDHMSAPNTTTDYSAYVTKVPSDTDIVFFPTQKPGDAQTMAQQLIEQGKKAKVFGGDGSNGAAAVQGAGSYVSNFAPDDQPDPVQQDDHRRLEEGQPREGRSARSGRRPTGRSRSTSGDLGGLQGRRRLDHAPAVFQHIKRV